jgi:hypothetical protein
LADWDRSTPWRQGHLLSPESLKVLFSKNDDPDQIGVVISHPCDLAQDPAAEPNAEVIIGKRVESPDGNFSHGKNARKLHLPVTAGTTRVVIQISATDKCNVEKFKLADWTPEPAYQMSAEELSILQHWLAARYRRTAFPDEFDDRLNKARIPSRLTKLLEPLGEVVVCLFFDVDDGKELERSGDDDVYSLSIQVLYSDRVKPDAEQIAGKAAQAIESIFTGKFLDKESKTWKKIELDNCEAISERAISYYQSRNFKNWNADHVSLRADPQQETLPA